MKKEFYGSQEEDQEGFEAQQICIEKKIEPVPIFRLDTNEGNDLINDLRPTDFLPRSIYKQLSLKTLPRDLEQIETFHQPQKLIPICLQTSIKHKRYNSLQQKYQQRDYPMVYNKFQNTNPQDYLHSYINLQKVLDYSTLTFTTFNSNNKNLSNFDSNFESGNLLYAYKLNQNQYDLVLQNDTNTKGYNQWFYFSYQIKKDIQTTFNIVSMIKKKTLFQKGIKPCYNISQTNQWKQIPTSIKYFKNGVYRQNGESYYTLSFKHISNISGKIYFSLNLPYTFTKMVNFIKQIEDFQSQDILIQRKILCYSISNNPVPYLIFQSKKHVCNRQILFFARQHPGQTISSYIMESLLKSLLMKNRLLQKFKVFCIPMLNVDGVIYGNFRTNLSGYDINRQWKQTNKWMNPEVYALKKLILKLQKLEFVLDLHGHSKKFNSFIYACHNENKFQQKIFPFLMSKNSMFEIESCTYGLTRDKRTTARAFIKQQGINHIYTLQTSFYGYGTQNNYHRFESQHFDSLGTTIIASLQQLYFTQDMELKKYQDEISRIVERVDKNIDKYSNDSGSDSNPSQDQLSIIQRQKHVIPYQILQQKKTKQPKKHLKAFKKQPKSIRIIDKDKRSSFSQISNRQVQNSQRSQFRKTYESRSQNNKPIKPMNITQKHYKQSSISTQIKQVDKNQKIIFNKKKLQNIKPPHLVQKIQQNKFIKKQEQIQNISNLFLSTIRRGSVKHKRNNQSLVEQRIVHSIKQQRKSVNMRRHQKQKTLLHQEETLSNNNFMKNNLKQLSKLDRIVQERIRQKMSLNLLSKIPRMRHSQLNPGYSESDSNLLESNMGGSVIFDNNLKEYRQQSHHYSKRMRNSKNKKQLIFLSELMKPKIQTGKGYNIQVIGSSSQTHKYRHSLHNY